MKNRLLMVGSFVIFLAATSCGQKDLTPKPVAAKKLPIQEGYPKSVIASLQNHNTGLQHATRGWAPLQSQSVITISKTWSPNATLTVAFQGGTAALRAQIVQAIQPWSNASGIHFDFGPDPSRGIYREWTSADTTYQAHVRIAFATGGYWSMVGRDSIDPSLSKPNESSMNFEGFTDALPDDWMGTVRHEFGHAIGFQHEHQSPASPCESAFRWEDDLGYVRTKDMYGQFVPDAQNRKPGIYTVLEGPPNKWEKDQIDFNLKQLPNSVDLRFSAFDKDSIMKYFFPDWMFNGGEASPCWSAENLNLSAQDQKAALETYPKDPAEIQKAMTLQTSALKSLFRLSELPPQTKAQFKNKLNDLQANR